MSTHDQWIQARITEARMGKPLVTDSVSFKMTEALKGQLSEQQLSQKDLTKLAIALIADMSPRPSEAGSKQ